MKTRGFTIVEALLIVAAAGIISTLGLVAYNQTTLDAQAASF